MAAMARPLRPERSAVVGGGGAPTTWIPQIGQNASPAGTGCPLGQNRVFT